MDVFSESAARSAAAHWGFGADARLTLLCISENATYLVADPSTGDRGVLRLNRPGYHTRQQIESELAWTDALRREGVVCTPASLPMRRGGHVAVLDVGHGRHAVMFDVAEGVAPAPGSQAAGMPAIGELAARLHLHSRRWARPEGFRRFAWDLPAALGDARVPPRWGGWRAAADRDVRPILEAAEEWVIGSLTSYGQSPERFGLIHSDLRAANLLVADVVTVIDFDDCGLSWFAYDVAAAMSFLEHRLELAELTAGFLTGYRRVAAFSDEDLRVLPALIMLRRLQLLGWSVSHAETEMVRSLGPGFAAESAEVAQKFLSGRLLGTRQDL